MNIRQRRQLNSSSQFLILIQLGTHAFKPLKHRVNVYHIKLSLVK